MRVEPVDQITERVGAGQIHRQFFFLLNNVQDEDKNGAFDQSDHRAIEPDREQVGEVFHFYISACGNRRESRADADDRPDETERRNHPRDVTDQ